MVRLLKRDNVGDCHKSFFVVAHKIATFNRTFIMRKENFEVVAEIVCPKSKETFEILLLSRRAIVHRVNAIIIG